MVSLVKNSLMAAFVAVLFSTVAAAQISTVNDPNDVLVDLTARTGNAAFSNNNFDDWLGQNGFSAVHINSDIIIEAEGTVTFTLIGAINPRTAPIGFSVLGTPLFSVAAGQEIIPGVSGQPPLSQAINFDGPVRLRQTDLGFPHFNSRGEPRIGGLGSFRFGTFVPDTNSTTGLDRVVFGVDLTRNRDRQFDTVLVEARFAAPTPVPEPSAFLLLFAALALIAFRQRSSSPCSD